MAKAAKFLGIENNAIVDETTISVQHSGYLWIKEADKRGLNNSWKKRFCVVKDGFFLWYVSNTHDGFDRKPKGIFPLNGSWLNHLESGGERMIELVHPDIARANFLLRADSKDVANDWFYCFENSKKATWENAQLGYAMLEKMKAQGTKMEAEKAEAVKALENKVSRLNKENTDKVKILQREQRQADKFAKRIEEEEAKLKEQAENIQNIEKMIEEEEKVHKEAADKRKSLERKLRMANMALRRLEEAFSEEFKDSNKTDPFLAVDVKKSVAALRGFFEQTIQTHRANQKKFVGKKLHQIKTTLGRKPAPPKK